MKSNDLLCWLGSVVGSVTTAIQSDEVMRWIQLALTIISTLVALAYTIWKWWRKAKEDGKISEEEIDELVEEVNQVVNKEKEGEKHD